MMTPPCQRQWVLAQEVITSCWKPSLCMAGLLVLLLGHALEEFVYMVSLRLSQIHLRSKYTYWCADSEATHCSCQARAGHAHLVRQGTQHGICKQRQQPMLPVSEAEATLRLLVEPKNQLPSAFRGPTWVLHLTQTQPFSGIARYCSQRLGLVQYLDAAWSEHGWLCRDRNVAYVPRITLCSAAKVAFSSSALSKPHPMTPFMITCTTSTLPAMANLGLQQQRTWLQGAHSVKGTRHCKLVNI